MIFLTISSLIRFSCKPHILTICYGKKIHLLQEKVVTVCNVGDNDAILLPMMCFIARECVLVIDNILKFNGES